MKFIFGTVIFSVFLVHLGKYSFDKVNKSCGPYTKLRHLQHEKSEKSLV